MSLRSLAYRAASGRAGTLVLSRLARHVRMPFGEAARTHPRHRMLVVVTIDTEGGYVEQSERRVWQGRAPDAFQGYTYGIRNVLDVLDRHHVKGTFFVAPHGRSARGAELAAVERAILSIPRGGHDIGLHLHPSSDRALAARVGAFADGSPRYLAIADMERLVAAGRELLAEMLDREHRALAAFRWGNWGLDDRAARIVADAGFRIDSSAVPGLRDAKSPRRPRFDWSARRSVHPWEIAPGLLELPIATFRFMGVSLRADPIYRSLLFAALERHRELAPREDAPFVFVVMTHSNEATYRDGSPTRALADLDQLLGLARRLPDVEVVTSTEAAAPVWVALSRFT